MASDPTLPVRIVSTGVYRPRHSDVFDARARIASRPRAGIDETASMMAAAALTDAAGTTLALGELDRLIVASIIPEQPIPTTAILVARRLGLAAGITAYDINASCLGFLQALESAAHAITIGACRRAGVVAVELATLGLNEADAETASLFGDGAAAVILAAAAPSENSAILALRFAAHPEGADLCAIRAGGSRWNIRRPPANPGDYLFAMQGRRVARFTMEIVPPFLDALLAGAGVELDRIACLIPHQASPLGLQFIQRLVRDSGVHVVDIIRDHGNQVSASLPSGLHAAIASGRLRRGELGLLLGSAAGISLGGMVFRY